MLRLYLIRHAKSSWKDDSIKDFDRPLNKRGQRDAPMMAEFMASQFPKPDLLLTSPAKRAHETAIFFAAQWHTEITISPDMYMATAGQLMNVIKSKAAHLSIAMIGHNPGLQELCERITTTTLENIATSAVAVIDLEIKSWKTITNSSGRLTDYLAPKLIRNTRDNKK